jgi:hypothetical protein
VLLELLVVLLELWVVRQVDVVLFFKVEAFEAAQERFVFDLVLMVECE